MASEDDRIFTWVTYLTAYLLIGALLLRALQQYAASPLLWRMAALLLVFLALYSLKPLLPSRLRWMPPLYFLVQTVLVLVLLRQPGEADFFATLFVALSVQIMRPFPPRLGYACIGAWTIGMGLLLVGGRGVMGLAMAALYGAFCVLFASFTLAIQRAQATRASNRLLLAELQEANRRLQAQAAEVERLAIARERNRMARELHDSVTQTIFSMTLGTRSALLLLDRDPAQAAGPLQRLQELARAAQSELHALVERPGEPPAMREDWIARLRQHLAERHRQDNLSATLEVAGDCCLTPAEEEGLLGIVQEALNNVAKHAGTTEAAIRLHLEAPCWMEIRDAGLGFDVAASAASGHLGLAGMRERAAEIGWTLTVDSVPGSGTCVHVAGPQKPEREL